MEYIADLHIHSKYSMATSSACEPVQLAAAAVRKGIDLLGTGDFTHALYRAELKEKLCPMGNGLYRLKGDINSPAFMVSGEISCIYKRHGRLRKVHMLILLPSLEAAEALSLRLERIGNLHSDGRPILGVDAYDLCAIALQVCPEAMLIPAHIWTPHFSLFGAYSGFDDIRECFADLTPHIAALETGLSSDPVMNRCVSGIDSFALVSNSDAHSAEKIGREASIFTCPMTYEDIRRGLNGGGLYGTLEFFPQEGKYHWDGHRNCGLGMHPKSAHELGGICPVCGKPLTAGVLRRVLQLSDRSEQESKRLCGYFEYIVPLMEVISTCTGVSLSSKKTAQLHGRLIEELGPELYILRKAQIEDISALDTRTAEGIRRLRCGQVTALSGFDGQYGRISFT